MLGQTNICPSNSTCKSWWHLHSPPPQNISLVQKMVGTFLYYSLAINPTMLVAFRDLESTQTKSTGKTYKDVVWVINYSASHPMAVIWYKASDIIFRIHVDASYLSVSRARSQSGVHHYLKQQLIQPTKQWSHQYHLRNHGKCHGISGRGQNRFHLHQYPIWYPLANLSH